VAARVKDLSSGSANAGLTSRLANVAAVRPKTTAIVVKHRISTFDLPWCFRQFVGMETTKVNRAFAPCNIENLSFVKSQILF
jgi:hypothetical protein